MQCNLMTQNTGKEALAGPSVLGVIPTGEFLTTVPFGGGYYYISPIPNRRVADIGQQFFMKTLHHHFAPYLPK